MTLYLNFRSSPIAGSVVYPRLMRGDDTDPSRLALVPRAEIDGLFGGKNVLFVVHGFNVRQRNGVASYAKLDRELGLSGSDVMVGVLWPGDFWIPAINYPFEGSDAMDCGDKLADYCGRFLGRAQRLSFMSHSLGARLVLRAVAALGAQKPKRKAGLVCVTAGAINMDCLETEYAAAAANSEAIRVLASHEDSVLKVAFRIGDPISNILHDDHRFFEKALGYDGPSPGSVPLLAGNPWQIPDNYDYGHGSYLPPVDPIPPGDPLSWIRVAEYVRRAFFGQPQVPPSPFPPPDLAT